MRKKRMSIKQRNIFLLFIMHICFLAYGLSLVTVVYQVLGHMANMKGEVGWTRILWQYIYIYFNVEFRRRRREGIKV